MSYGVLGFILTLLWAAAMTEGATDYGKALTSSLLFFEAQRAGKLPADQRVKWRGDSALKDGSDAGVDLSGGYYDAGDNVKFGFPMAYTITLLSWGTIDFQTKLIAKHELPNALKAIKWGTDYLIRAHPQPDVLYGEVGDGDSDHACWQRPEDMTTPRKSYAVTDQNPGADLAGETAAAFAAASIAFRSTDARYSNRLLSHARQLFNFAVNHPGTYDTSIPVTNFYKSSGYQDELVWAAAWLYRATKEKPFLDFITKSGNSPGVQTTFSWDNKYVGAQVLVAKLVLDGEVPNSGVWSQYKSEGEQFICNCVGKGSSNVQKTAGGMLWFLPWANLQYVGSASLVAVSYASYLSSHKANLQCPGGTVTPSDLFAFARSQMEYVLGNNPKGMSYMVGYGSRYPTQVHHRGASIVSIRTNSAPVTCKGGYELWFNRNAPNPNVLVGAIVGGPDQQDGYTDQRGNYQQAETGTAITAPFVGVFASLV